MKTKNKKKKVLVVATSRKTRGGITSVIKAHEIGEQWKKFHCKSAINHKNNKRKNTSYLPSIPINSI